MQRIRGFEKISKEQFLKDIKGEMLSYDDIILPRRATKKSSGYDFYSLKTFILKPNEEIILSTGIKTYMQDNEELKIFVRSSMGIKYNIRLKNQTGKIDADYYNNSSNEGHICIALKNEGDKDWIVNKGNAVAQGSFYNYLIGDNDCPISEERKGGIGSTNNNN
jgi:dUTP pyrophosphatase